MTDLKIMSDGELMVAHVEGLTEQGIEFVDAYLPPDAKIVAVDSGRIVVPTVALLAFRETAGAHGLVCEEVASVYGG